MHSPSWKYCTSWELTLHFVRIFRTDWSFLTKFGNSDPSFNRNILEVLCLKFETFAHAQIAVIHYYILFTSFLHDMKLKLTLGYLLINKVD